MDLLNANSEFVRVLVVMFLPLTGIVLGVSVVGTIVLRVFQIQDPVLLYAFRLLGVVLAIVLLGAPLSQFLIQHSRELYSLTG